MKMRCIVSGVALCAALSGCGGSGSATSPTAAIAQVAGTWRASARLTQVSTTECVGQTLAAAGALGATNASTFQIPQSGNGLTAVINDSASGGTIRYTGTADANSMTLNFQSCDLCAVRNLVCPTGEARDLEVQSETIQAAVAGNTTATGTDVQTFNVLVAGTRTPAGTLVVNAAFTATKQ